MWGNESRPGWHAGTGRGGLGPCVQPGARFVWLLHPQISPTSRASELFLESGQKASWTSPLPHQEQVATYPPPPSGTEPCLSGQKEPRLRKKPNCRNGQTDGQAGRWVDRLTDEGGACALAGPATPRVLERVSHSSWGPSTCLTGTWRAPGSFKKFVKVWN